MAIVGQQIGQKLCDALQLPPQTRSFVLRVETDQVVSVECVYYPKDAKAIVEALAEYELVRKEPKEPVPLNFDTWMRERTEAAHAAFMRRHARVNVTFNTGGLVSNTETARRFGMILAARELQRAQRRM